MKAVVLNRIVLILACAGMYVSGVLSIGALLSISVPCGASHGCDAVARHPSSHLLGFPNSYLGFILYALIGAVALWRLAAPRGRLPVVVGFTLTAAGTLFSLYLTYISITEIGATCPWCLTSAGIMVVLFFLHAVLWSFDEEARARNITPDAILAVALVLALSIGVTVQAQEMLADSNKGAHIMEGVSNSQVLPEGAHTLGNPAAPLAIVEFGDLVCPSCKAEFPKVRDYVGLHPGKVKYVFRHYPVFQLKGHEQAAPAAVAAEIASESGHFWDFVGAVYSKQESEFDSINVVLDLARGVGLDAAKTLARIQSAEDPAFKRVMKDIDDGSKLGVNQTPTFFIVAPGLHVRAATAMTLYDDLKRPEYAKFLNGQ